MKIGLGINIFNNKVLNSFSAEYTAILNTARAAGYTLPNVTEQKLQNQLILDLKSNGIWAKLDAFYMFANTIYDNNYTYSGSAFARINWKNPTQNYGIGAPNLPSISAAAGFTGSAVGGANQGLNLNLAANAGTNFGSPAGSPVNGSFGVFVGTMSSSGNSRLMGATGNSSTINRIRKGTSAIAATGAASGTITTGAGNSNTFYHLNRNNTIATMYISGVSGSTSGLVTWVADSQNWHVLKYGDDAAGFGDSQIKSAFVGGDLSATTPINLPVTFDSLVKNYITNLNLISSFTTYAAMAKEMQYTVL